MSKTYYTSPFGVARFPWLNKADTKFNTDGLFKVTLVLAPGPETEDFVSFVKKAAQEAFDAECEKMTVGERKKFHIYLPIEKEEDDQGNETGNWLAHFKQNAIIRRADKTEIIVHIGVKDASGTKDVKKPVFAGSVLRVMYSPRAVKVASAQTAGVRLDFASVQVKKLQESTGRSFEAIEGYEEDQESFDPGAPIQEY